jgi:nucleotide-binding universal stress UspA family protein
MNEFKRVLCPVDLSVASVRPLAYAQAVARWYGGHVTALVAVSLPTPILVADPGMVEMPPVVPALPEEVLVQLLREKISLAGIDANDVTTVLEHGDPAAAIDAQAAAMSADVIVMGTHGRHGLERFVLGSVTEDVLRRAPCPVLTVPPHAPAAPPNGTTVKRILCAIDFSAASVAAFECALDLARRAGATVLAVNAIDSLAEEEPRENAHWNVSEARHYFIKDGRRRLDELVSREAARRDDVTVMVRPGRAYREILQAASERDVDLIAMGAQGRGGAALALFGSTTQQVVRGASCPVLTVR